MVIDRRMLYRADSEALLRLAKSMKIGLQTKWCFRCFESGMCEMCKHTLVERISREMVRLSMKDAARK